MAVYKRASRRRSVLVLLVLTSLTLITLDVRGGNGGVTRSVRDFAQDAVAPVQEGVDGLFTPISNWWDGVTKAADIKDENVRLRRQLAEARGQQAAAQGALRENRALKGLTKLTFVQDIPGVDAQIVTGSPSNFESTVGLDKGRDAGIGPGMPVVAGEGLVGRVTDASGRRSTVLLLTDPSSGVSVRLATSGLLGIASGRSGSDLLRLDVESGRYQGEARRARGHGGDRALAVSRGDPGGSSRLGEQGARRARTSDPARAVGGLPALGVRARAAVAAGARPGLMGPGATETVR